MNEPRQNGRPARHGKGALIKNRWWRRAAVVGVVLVVFAGIRIYTHRDAVSGVAPAFTATALDGSQLTLAQYRGKPVLVHFWATWCPVCKLEQDSIVALAKDYAIVGVAVWSGGGHDVASHYQGRVPFVTVADPAGVIARQYGVTGVPTTFVVDGTGVIRFVEVGYTTELGLRARLYLAENW